MNEYVPADNLQEQKKEGKMSQSDLLTSDERKAISEWRQGQDTNDSNDWLQSGTHECLQ